MLFIDLFILLFFSEKKVIFLFNKEDTVSFKKKGDVFYIEGINLNFKHKEVPKKTVLYEDIKIDLYSVNKYKNEVKGKGFLEYYKQYNYYLFIPKNKKSGCLVRVKINNIIIHDEPIED